MEKINYEKELKEINDRIAVYKEYARIAEIIKPIFEKFSGRLITKAIATAIKKVLPDYMNVFYDDNYGMYHVSIWDGHVITYDHEMHLLLGYKPITGGQFDNIVRHEKITGEFNYFYFHADDHVNKLEKELPRFKEAADRWNNLYIQAENIANEFTSDIKYKFNMNK